MFSARRKPKRIARDGVLSRDVEEDEPETVVRRPGAVKSKSKLRLSFQPGESTGEDAKSSLKSSRPVGSASALSSLPTFHTDRHDESRPTYSKSTLDELRNSTPSTPKDVQIYDPMSDTSGSALDVAAKFGSASINAHSAIPSAAEIKEKKERRARLAKEQGADDFIPLEDYDSDGEFKPQRMQVGSYLVRDNDKDSRLVRDDEDFAEGFEDLVEDPGKVALSRKGLMNQARNDRNAIRELIDEAEGSEADESDSEAERNYAYESAQTHHGMDGLAAHSQQSKEANRPRQPRETAQIPKLAVALGKLKEAIQRIELEKAKIERRRADVRRERAEIKASQEHVQQSLEEAGREAEKLREKALSASPAPTQLEPHGTLPTASLLI